jgi:FMN phosphatase YigB (HAD superfamily)/ribulose-5-phosphate 4-epimerase/fuculose-1-phosphate aldolase
MFYKGVIFDLDNTIYSYEVCHNNALDAVILFLQNNYGINKTYYEIKDLYENISKKLKYELKSTAASHNKSIYFKQLSELLKLHYSNTQILNDLYWKTFFDNMVCFEGVQDFIAWNKNLGVKIGILTDYETEHQIQKLEKLGIIDYVDVLVTSEEVGIEKPSCQMFQTILRKMKLSPDDVIMIGDDFNKDINGALNMNILPYWFNTINSIVTSSKSYTKYIEFNSFRVLYNEFNDIQHGLNKLKQISKYCGERFDLVQAGGGNTSVKHQNLMFIKASGYNLANIDENNGYVTIDNTILLEDIKNNQVKEVTEYNFIGNKRGSIETFMHSILKKYTIHLHPIQINRILVTKQAKTIINEIYPNSLVIDYFTPGIKVCNEIKEKYNNEKIIFLINHGIIVTCDKYDEIFNLLEDILEKFESYQDLDFSKYKHTNKISALVNDLFKTNNVSYLCEDTTIKYYLNNKLELFKESITFPDFLIYCGLETLFDLSYMEEYKNKYNEPPKIIIENGNIYINGNSISKCKDIEEVLKSNLMILDTELDKNVLSFEEICFLNNWDAEKYRKML